MAVAGAEEHLDTLAERFPTVGSPVGFTKQRPCGGSYRDTRTDLASGGRGILSWQPDERESVEVEFVFSDS